MPWTSKGFLNVRTSVIICSLTLLKVPLKSTGFTHLITATSTATNQNDGHDATKLLILTVKMNQFCFASVINAFILAKLQRFPHKGPNVGKHNLHSITMKYAPWEAAIFDRAVNERSRTLSKNCSKSSSPFALHTTHIGNITAHTTQQQVNVQCKQNMATNCKHWTIWHALLSVLVLSENEN